MCASTVTILRPAGSSQAPPTGPCHRPLPQAPRDVPEDVPYLDYNIQNILTICVVYGEWVNLVIVSAGHFPYCTHSDIALFLFLLTNGFIVNHSGLKRLVNALNKPRQTLYYDVVHKLCVVRLHTVNKNIALVMGVLNISRNMTFHISCHSLFSRRILR